MLVWRARHIEAVRIRERLGVAIDRRQTERHDRARLEAHAVEVDRALDLAGDELRRRVVAQHLLDRARDERRIAARSLHLRGVLQQTQHAVREQACRRFLPGVDDAEDIGDEFSRVEDLAFVLRACEGGQHARAGRASRRVDQFAKPRLQPLDGRQRMLRAIDDRGRPVADPRVDIVGPALHLLLVRERDSENRQDDVAWQQVGEALDEVDGFVGRQAVEQPAEARVDHGRVPGDLVRHEGLHHQAFDARVRLAFGEDKARDEQALQRPRALALGGRQPVEKVLDAVVGGATCMQEREHIGVSCRHPSARQWVPPERLLLAHPRVGRVGIGHDLRIVQVECDWLGVVHAFQLLQEHL